MHLSPCGRLASAAPAAYRARVSLVAQRPPRLPGAPAALWASILAFSANADVRSADAGETAPLLVPQPAVASGDASFGERQASGWRLSDVPCAAPAAQVTPTRLPADPEALLARWGAPPRIFHADWSTLSGGEAARASLAISLALQLRRGGDGVLLLDGEWGAWRHARCGWTAPPRTLLSLLCSVGRSADTHAQSRRPRWTCTRHSCSRPTCWRASRASRCSGSRTPRRRRCASR